MRISVETCFRSFCKSLSTNKATAVCATVARSGFNISSPSQSGVWQATMKYEEDDKLKIKKFWR